MNPKALAQNPEPKTLNPGPSLVWFRNDLRTADNSALWSAAQNGPVIACFLITPGQWQKHDMADCRVNFLLRNLKELRVSLRNSGIPLIVQSVSTFADAPVALLAIAQQYRCQAVYWNNEYPLDERRRDKNCEQTLVGAGLRVRRFHDALIAPPGTVLRKDGGAFKVFTPFKNAWLRLLRDEGLPDVLPAPKSQSYINCRLGAIPASLPEFPHQPSFAKMWPAGEAEARRRLARFIEQAVKRYHEQRDFPSVAGTSGLSPYLAAGIVSPRQCLHACLSVNRGEYDSGDQGVRTWLNELIWREFYHHIVVAFSHICMHKPFLPQTESIPWRKADNYFRCWCEGRTGVPIVDAGMRELLETGWMHNRVRMIVAMFLSKNLLIDWRRGEQFFMRHLIDGDFAANNGGWQWSASTGTDAAPYFRVFNPFSQAARFDPEGEYIRRYVPELRSIPPKYLHDPEKLAANRPGDYPAMIVDLKLSRQQAIDVFRRL